MRPSRMDDRALAGAADRTADRLSLVDMAKARAKIAIFQMSAGRTNAFGQLA